MATGQKYNYKVKEILGTLTKNADLHADWAKSVLYTLLESSGEKEAEDGIDIRDYNSKVQRMGARGIRLTIDEANTLVDILLANGYGSMESIEEAYNKRVGLYKK